jgi:hypothetical protein
MGTLWASMGGSWETRRIAAGDVERIGPIPVTSTDERRSPTNLPPRRD